MLNFERLSLNRRLSLHLPSIPNLTATNHVVTERGRYSHGKVFEQRLGVCDTVPKLMG